jgi:hypothetical protein
MSRVRVLVGTRKGAFILTADGRRDRWDVNGPLFGGWELYHLKGSPAEPNRIYDPSRPAGSGRSSSVRRRWQHGRPTSVRRHPGHPPVVRRHTPPVGVRPSGT